MLLLLIIGPHIYKSSFGVCEVEELSLLVLDTRVANHLRVTFSVRPSVASIPNPYLVITNECCFSALAQPFLQAVAQTMCNAQSRLLKLEAAASLAG